MSINLIKWLNFNEGCCIYVNEANGIPTEEVSILNGKYGSDIFIPCPHTLNSFEEITLTDKNSHVWNIKITLTAIRKLDIDIKIDNVSVLTGSSTVGNVTTDLTHSNGFYIMFGYDSVSRYSKIYLFEGYVAGFSTSYATGSFINGSATRTGNSTKYPVPITLTDFLSAASDVPSGKSYINLLNTGYFESDGISGTTVNLSPLSYGNATFDSHVVNILDDTPDVPESDTDPYAPGGYSDVSPSNGSFDLTSDTISVPGLPTLSATNAGLVTVYIPTGPQLSTFASLLFGRTFLDAFLNAVTTLFVDPLEAVIGLSIIPVAPSLATAKQVTVAFIGLTTSDGPLMMQPAASQYVEVNCGTIHVDEYSGSALDYAPYSKFHIYLPYIGTRELSTDEIRNKDLKVVYHIDIVSGSCVALLEVDGSVLYQFAGNCATPIPINGRDFSRMVTAGIQLAAAFAGGSAGAGVGSVAAGNIRKPADYISTNSSFKTLVKTLDSEEGVMPTANKTAGTGVDAEHLVSATAGVVAGMKPHIQHASGIGGSAGMLGVQKPYLIAEIPRQSLAKDYNKFVGYPSNITSVLSELSGFTQIEMIHLKGIPCTETELSEIDKMLKNGVIL